MKPIQIIDAETTKLEVHYCIPDWLRNEQIKMNCAKYPKRIQPAKVLRDESVALVCFGPSLNATWEKIKDFKYIISCSGSHKFLRERGIIPTWHCEVDPRAHKIKLIGEDIAPETEFLIASCCHPELLTHLEKYNARITLWHTYSGEEKAKIPLVFPRGEWILTGGANVGLRALVIARFLGFTDIQVFGMDGCFPRDGELKHAAYHPNVAKDYIIAQFNGKEYATTTAFLECARQTFHEISMLPDIKITFYGEGLIQDMAAKKMGIYDRKDRANIAFYSIPTISAEYINQNRILHHLNPTYGISVLKHIETIKKLYEKTEATSLLDYGCGKGLLAKNLDFPIWEYDPAIEGKDSPPRPADLVVCIDVLEHIEPDLLEPTLKDIARCVKKVGYFVINTGPSVKLLPDGRNTHLIQQSREWWAEKLSRYFLIPEGGMIDKGIELHVVASPKSKKNTLEAFAVTAKEKV